jgi:hypothetical protein
MFSFYLGALAGGLLTLRHLGPNKPAGSTATT